MYPSVKRLLGAILLIATVGTSAVLAVRSDGTTLAARPLPVSALSPAHHG